MSDDGSKIIQAKSQINELFNSGNQVA